MVTRAQEFESGLSQRRDSARKIKPQRLNSLPLLILVALSLSLGLALLVTATVMLAQVNGTSHLVDPSPRYLPGSPLPPNVSCYTPVDEHIPRCSVPLAAEQGLSVYFDFNLETRRIIRSVIPANDYTMRQLYAAWGKPNGVRWSTTQVTVYWHKKSALFYTDDFRPHSRVEFILYDRQVPDDLPAWNGFRPPQI